jgi:membrane-associated phospholipid phosphatase
MLSHFDSNFLKRFGLRAVLFVSVLCALGLLMPVAVSAQDGAASNAGEWSTWVLDSGSQFRLDAPPDEAATAAEIDELLAMAADRDEESLLQIAYWNSGAPAYRWNQIAIDALLKQAMPGNMALRDLALLHVAIYDATVAAWDSKYTYNRPRPSELEPALAPVIPNPTSPSYPSEYAVTAGAASAVLAYLFPEDAQSFQEMAQEAVHSRLVAGVEYPSDVEAGLSLGQQVADLVIARGQADGSDAAWTGTVPTEAGMWTGENPIFPTAGSWKTWVLTSGDEFRPVPPPAYDSDEMTAQMDEVRNFERTPVTNSIAQFWEFGSGGRRIYWFWNDVATRLILEARLDDNPPMAARAYALTNIAGYDAMVACWDAKYTYWGIRPFQIDSEFTPLFTTPNHPSYPSAHSCLSSAMGGMLAELFPVNAQQVNDLVFQATESRIWAGIHVRADVDAGKEIGDSVVEAVIAASDGA